MICVHCLFLFLLAQLLFIIPSVTSDKKWDNLVKEIQELIAPLKDFVQGNSAKQCEELKKTSAELKPKINALNDQQFEQHLYSDSKNHLLDPLTKAQENCNLLQQKGIDKENLTTEIHAIIGNYLCYFNSVLIQNELYEITGNQFSTEDISIRDIGWYKTALDSAMAIIETGKEEMPPCCTKEQFSDVKTEISKLDVVIEDSNAIDVVIEYSNAIDLKKEQNLIQILKQFNENVLNNLVVEIKSMREKFGVAKKNDEEESEVDGDH